MIIAVKKSYGNTYRVYTCSSEFLISKYKGDVPLMYCGSYTSVVCPVGFTVVNLGELK